MAWPGRNEICNDTQRKVLRRFISLAFVILATRRNILGCTYRTRSPIYDVQTISSSSLPHAGQHMSCHGSWAIRLGPNNRPRHSTLHCTLHPPAGSRPAAQSWPLHVARWASRFADTSSRGGSHSGIFTVSSASPQALRTAARRPLREAQHSTTECPPPAAPRPDSAHASALRPPPAVAVLLSHMPCPAAIDSPRPPQNPRRTCWPGPVDGRACDAARLSSSPTALPPPCRNRALVPHTFLLLRYRHALRRLRRVNRLRPAMPKPPPTPAASRIVNTRDPISRIVR